MDSNDIEEERGITISPPKNTAVHTQRSWAAG